MTEPPATDIAFENSTQDQNGRKRTGEDPDKARRN